jgi:hypothetical protein
MAAHDREYRAAPRSVESWNSISIGIDLVIRERALCLDHA